MSSFKSAPPERIRRSLAAHAVPLRDIHVSVTTDISASQGGTPDWLVASVDRILIFDGTPSPRLNLNIAEISAIRSIPAVGSGILQARVGDIWVDLLRYSNRLKFEFDRIQKILETLQAGNKPAPEALRDELDPNKCPKCSLTLEFPGELCPRCLDHGAALQRVIQMLRPYWKPTSLMAVLLIMGLALDMVWPLLTRYLVDHVIAGAPSGTPPGEPFRRLAVRPAHSLLIIVVASLAGIHVGRAVLNVLTGRIASRVGNAMTFDIRGQLVAKLQQLGLAYYSKQETGSLVGRVAYDTDAIQSFMSQVTSGFLMQFLLVAISFAMMFSMDPVLALWAILPAPLVIGGAFLYWRFVHPDFQRYWDRSSKQAGLLNGTLSGIRVVKAFAQEDREYAKFQKASMDVRNTRQKMDGTAAWFYPLMAIVFQAGGWIIWYVGGSDVLGGRITLGTLMAFFGYLSMFYGPLGNLTNLTTWLTQFSTQIHRIGEILDTPSRLPDAETPVTPEHSRGEIVFENVTFGYSRGVSVLRNLNLKIRPGEKIGIVGRSGSGKTSLINLLCRFYDVDTGQILLDGVDVRSIGKQELRSRIALVLQEPFLFRGTLHENISYGRPGAKLDELIAATRAANAHDFILAHPLAYDTSVGERGQELSGGERQRVSIARALLCSPPVLVLDEATSSLDSESELSIRAALDEVSRERTTLIIAHRLSTLRDCDRIFVIENGQVSESGSHRELMDLDGHYARWVRIQQGKEYIEMDRTGKPIVPKKTSEAHRPRWLDPQKADFSFGGRGELEIRIDGERSYAGAFLLRCFPVQHPESYLSVRYVDADGRSREIGLIREVAALPASSQAVVRAALDRRYFFHRIRRVHSIRKFAQFLGVSVATERAAQEFIMRYSPEAAQEYGQFGKLLMDVEDNLYLLPDVRELPRPDRDTFHRYVYW